MSLGVSERTSEQISAAERAMREKQMSEWCERMSERMSELTSEWTSIYVWIPGYSGPQCRETERSTQAETFIVEIGIERERDRVWVGEEKREDGI